MTTTDLAMSAAVESALDRLRGAVVELRMAEGHCTIPGFTSGNNSCVTDVLSLIDDALSALNTQDTTP